MKKPPPLKSNKGAIAFPLAVTFANEAGITFHAYEQGMTMRQYYKAAALVGILSESGMHNIEIDNVAIMAGRIADAMVREDEIKDTSSDEG